jgi:parallel beta-helix repeat protein
MNNISLIPLSLGIFLGTSTLANLPIQAQTPSIINQQEQIIEVNPQTGNDQKGDGSQVNPFKTITQALMLAKSGTIIKLAPGNYSEESGENFPLILKNNITLQGDSSNKGKDIIIKGNGTYISPTSAGQHVTIVATEKAGEISGITVINPHNQGYGLWIESANPNISHNSFLNSGNGGVSINGESAPLITDNYFHNIQGNGIVIYGKSQPQIKNNEFLRTGFGVSILQDSAPILIGNRISQNRIGVILQNNSQATLRDNLIEFSEEDGLVAVSNSWVNLGKNNEPGKNVFANNKSLDIRNLTKEQTIPAFGNQFSSNTQGKIDLAGQSDRIEPIINNKPMLALNSTPNNNPDVVREPLPPLQSIGLPPENMTPTPPPPTTTTPKNSPNLPPSPPPIISSNSGTLPPPPTVNKIQNNPTNNSTSSIPIPVVITSPSITPTLNSPPPVVTPNNSQRRNLEDLITVNPDFNNGRNEQSTFRNDIIIVPKASDDSSSEQSQPQPQVLVYRVLVDPLNQRQQEEIKRKYPQAFVTTYNGQSLWQIGSYQDKKSADEVLETINKIGVSGLIVR